MDDQTTPAAPATDAAPDATAPGPTALPRRDFLALAGLGAGAMLTACATATPPRPVTGIAPARRVRGDGHVVVVGAGIWGAFTAYHLRRRGARVTLVDLYGPGNGKATSGDETRGIRSSYGDRAGPTGELWTAWAHEAIQRWREFDEEWGPRFKTRFFYTTGDIICRAAPEPFTTRTAELWTRLGIPFESLTGDEVRRRWPVINADDTVVALYEPAAGVARARGSNQAIAGIARDAGVRFVLARATPGAVQGGRMQGVSLSDGSRLEADAYVFCCGAWLPKLFPRLLQTRMRVPRGTAMYYGTPEGDQRFTAPNLPSFNFPGTTGWPALPADNRGFRVRGGLAAPPPPPGTPAPPPPPPEPPQNDPDTSDRWASQARLESTRRFVVRRFPLLADAPLLHTHTCHYESSVNRNFIIDRIPQIENAWIAGVGQAEGFKFAPVAGEYVAQRVLGHAGDPALVEAFRFPTQEYDNQRSEWENDADA